MWFALGFAGNCGLWAFFGYSGAGLAAGILTAALLLALLGRRYTGMRIAAIVLTGFAAAVAWCGVFERHVLDPLDSLDGTIQQLSILAEDYSCDTDYGKAADGSIVLNGRTYAARVYWNTDDNVEPGMVLEGSFRIRLTTPGSLRGQTAHSGKCISICQSASVGRYQRFAI